MAGPIFFQSPSPPPLDQSRPSTGPSSPTPGRSPMVNSSQVSAMGLVERGDNPPPSPSSASQSDGGDVPDGDGYGDMSPSYKLKRSGLDRRTTLTSVRSELPRPNSLVPHSPSSNGGSGWREARAANVDLLSPANLPHEILLHIFKFLLTRTTGHSYLRTCLLVCRSWCLCGVELLWHRPAFFHLSSLVKLIQTIRSPDQTFQYVTFIRRLNFSGIATELTDQLFGFMSKCSRLERLTIAECSELSDEALTSTLASLTNLVSIDLTNVKNLTDQTVEVMARNCKRLQGVNFTNCKKITSRGVAALGENCPLLRRVKFCSCELIGDTGVLPLILGCPMLLEVDFYHCPAISDRAVRQMWITSSHVRELRLANCGPLTDAGFPAPARMLTSSAAALDLSPTTSTVRPTPLGNDFLNTTTGQHGSESAPTSRGASPLGEVRASAQSQIQQAGRAALGPPRNYIGSLATPLKPPKTFEHLRILDLTNCSTISDDAIEGIISNAPRIRNLGLSKCTRLTDEAIYSISKLTKNLQYLHLGHVSNITDRGMRHLVDHCTRIRYLDLANCTQLTDLTVMELAAKLPKLKRIGLVRVHHITDNALYALVERHLNLQRIHLSYCDKLGVAAVFWLLEHLPKVTHISLSGVTAFQRPELQAMCRPPPDEFSPTQRESFCVYSGHGVVELHHFLRGVYSSEASARQFSNQAGELSAEDYRAIHLMKERSERSRHDRRLRYHRTEIGGMPQTRIGSDAMPASASVRWPVDQRRSTLPEEPPSLISQRYLNNATTNARISNNYAVPPPSSASRFPLSHITTSSAFRDPRHRGPHEAYSDHAIEGSTEGREEEDVPLAPEDWRTNSNAAAPQGWPPGVSSPDLAQMDPRAWAVGNAHGEAMAAPPIALADPSSNANVRHLVDGFGPSTDWSSSGPSNNATRRAAEDWYAGANQASSVRGGSASHFPMNAGSSGDVRQSSNYFAGASLHPASYPSYILPGMPGVHDPRWGPIAPPGPSSHAPESLPSDTYATYSSSPAGGDIEEPVHCRGGGSAAVGSSSRSSSSSAQPHGGGPTSDSSVSVVFPPPTLPMLRSSAAASGESARQTSSRPSSSSHLASTAMNRSSNRQNGADLGSAAAAAAGGGGGGGGGSSGDQARLMYEEQRRAMARMNRMNESAALEFDQLQGQHRLSQQQQQQQQQGHFQSVQKGQTQPPPSGFKQFTMPGGRSGQGEQLADIPGRNGSPMRVDQDHTTSPPIPSSSSSSLIMNSPKAAVAAAAAAMSAKDGRVTSQVQGQGQKVSPLEDDGGEEGGGGGGGEEESGDEMFEDAIGGDSLMTTSQHQQPPPPSHPPPPGPTTRTTTTTSTTTIQPIPNPSILAHHPTSSSSSSSSSSSTFRGQAQAQAQERLPLLLLPQANNNNNNNNNTRGLSGLSTQTSSQPQPQGQAQAQEENGDGDGDEEVEVGEMDSYARLAHVREQRLRMLGER